MFLDCTGFIPISAGKTFAVVKAVSKSEPRDLMRRGVPYPRTDFSTTLSPAEQVFSPRTGMTLRNACINYVQLCYFLFLLPSFPPFPALSGVTVVTFPRPCLLHFWLLRLSLHLWGFLLGSTRRGIGCLEGRGHGAMGLRKSDLETSHQLETYRAHVRRFGMDKLDKICDSPATACHSSPAGQRPHHQRVEHLHWSPARCTVARSWESDEV